MAYFCIKLLNVEQTVAKTDVLGYNIMERNDNSIYNEGESKMSDYRFYGWNSTEIQDRNGLHPADYYDILSAIWCAETCAPRLRKNWSTGNKTMGQCSVTAFLMQDFFGGEVYGILRPGGNYHCFNVVGKCIFDLTSEQFGDEMLDYNNCIRQSREMHFVKEEKRKRYEYLKTKVMEVLKNGYECACDKL